MIVCNALSQILTLITDFRSICKELCNIVLMYESKCDFVPLHGEVSWRKKYCHLKVGVRSCIIKWFQCTKCV